MPTAAAAPSDQQRRHRYRAELGAGRQRIYFMSDRGGTPQIYRMSPDGGNADRVTFEGSYNANPRVAADGKSMVFVRRDGGREMLAAQDFASRQVQLLTQGRWTNRPFAPNGKPDRLRLGV